MDCKAQLELLLIPRDVVDLRLFAVILVDRRNSEVATSYLDCDDDVTETIAALPRASEALLLVTDLLPCHSEA